MTIVSITFFAIESMRSMYFLIIFCNVCGNIVDVGVVELREMKEGKQRQAQYEVDFIATNGQEKYYILSAYRINDEDKRKQELKSLKRIDDSFRKIVIVGDDAHDVFNAIWHRIALRRLFVGGSLCSQSACL